ncbi:MAG: hypothetical protein M3165_09685 [Actinomycetota bacterium]|nr:hypothetical protein [Actinomycetota bacterium]
MTDVLNLPLHDRDLLAEIEMVTELIAVATESDGPICERTIDSVLAVEPVRRAC